MSGLVAGCRKLRHDLQKALKVGERSADKGNEESPVSLQQGLKYLPDPALRFVARQPILDKANDLYGYEILFRDGVENSFRHFDLNAACRSTIDSSLLMGLDLLCGESRAFINCTRESLLSDYISLFPPNRVVVEILENVPPDTEVSHACSNLKRSGFAIALDDFVPGDARMGLLSVTDIIKVDWHSGTQDQLRSIVQNISGNGRRMLAEKVETREDFQTACEMGFDLFQGYFFSRPIVVQTREIPAGKMQVLLLLREVSKPVLDLIEIEKLIKRDASLSFRLLRYLNSSAFFFASEVKSIRHALLILGERQVRKWISLVVAVHAGDSGCGELVRMALARAHFCERVTADSHGEDFFFLGLLSLMDVILGVPMATLLEKVPVSQELKGAVRGKPTRMTPVLQLVQALEAGAWDQVSQICEVLRLEPGDATARYWQSVAWSRDAYRS